MLCVLSQRESQPVLVLQRAGLAAAPMRLVSCVSHEPFGLAGRPPPPPLPNLFVPLVGPSDCVLWRSPPQLPLRSHDPDVHQMERERREIHWEECFTLALHFSLRSEMFSILCSLMYFAHHRVSNCKLCHPVLFFLISLVYYVVSLIYYLVLHSKCMQS